MEPVADNRRIRRNALYLYGRMLLTVGVSLYTSRVVLDTLGVDNYGIYNVVGGIVTIFCFINGTMAGATQRFLNYEMGRSGAQRVQHVFSSALLIHLAVAAIVLLLAETVGLWFVNHHLDIAPERMFAANVTYQFSVLAALMTIVQIPYTAAIMAREHMGAYAAIAIENVMLKLAVAVSLVLFVTLDTLIIYAALMTAVAAVVFLTYYIYCRRNFSECRLCRVSDKDAMKQMMTFSGWDIYGNLCFVGRMQGVIVILNNFGGTVLNAAGNLTLTVSSTITSFAGSVITAFRPQVIQQYAAGNYERMQQLMGECARLGSVLLAVIVVPVIVNIDFLLHLWLKEVPDYTAAFCRLALIATFGEILITATAVGIHATGRVKLISFVSGTLYLLELPLMWWLIKASGMPTVVYMVHVAFVALILLVDTLILKWQMPEFALARYWVRGIAPGLVIAAIAMLAAWSCSGLLANPWLATLLTGAVSTAVCAALGYPVLIKKSKQTINK